MRMARLAAASIGLLLLAIVGDAAGQSSCTGSCGSSAPHQHPDNPAALCFCNADCTGYEDCCPGYESACGAASVTTPVASETTAAPDPGCTDGPFCGVVTNATCADDANVRLACPNRCNSCGGRQPPAAGSTPMAETAPAATDPAPASSAAAATTQRARPATDPVPVTTAGPGYCRSLGCEMPGFRVVSTDNGDVYCFCEAGCLEYNDCCPDYQDVCVSRLTTPPTTTDPTPPPTPAPVPPTTARPTRAPTPAPSPAPSAAPSSTAPSRTPTLEHCHDTYYINNSNFCKVSHCEFGSDTLTDRTYRDVLCRFTCNSCTEGPTAAPTEAPNTPVPSAAPSTTPPSPSPTPACADQYPPFCATITVDSCRNDRIKGMCRGTCDICERPTEITVGDCDAAACYTSGAVGPCIGPRTGICAPISDETGACALSMHSCSVRSDAGRVVLCAGTDRATGGIFYREGRTCAVAPYFNPHILSFEAGLAPGAAAEERWCVYVSTPGSLDSALGSRLIRPPTADGDCPAPGDDRHAVLAIYLPTDPGIYGTELTFPGCVDLGGGLAPALSQTCRGAADRVLLYSTCGRVGHNTDYQGVCGDYDECTAGACGADGACTNTDGSFICTCDAGAGYSYDPVSGTCSPGCPAGHVWDGSDCNDVDECAAGTDTCAAEGGVCTNTAGAFNCSCAVGFSGDGMTCDHTPCVVAGACGSNEQCTQTTGAGYSCSCIAGFAGSPCVDINECAADGACDTNAECTNTAGGHTCSCNSGWAGDGASCSDIDECASANICGDGDGAVCSNLDGTYLCGCDRGYQADSRTGLCMNIYECDTSPCDPRAICDDTVGSFECTCRTGYTGDGVRCRGIDECAEGLHQCARQADCIDEEIGYTCTCPRGQEWIPRESVCVEINECQRNPEHCDPDATCIDVVGSFSCICDDGFVGDGLSCDTLSPTTSEPTPAPTPTPTTSEPTRGPTAAPATSEPTSAPSASPASSEPTVVPSAAPSAAPATSEPTVAPIPTPTGAPSVPPTAAPTRDCNYRGILACGATVRGNTKQECNANSGGNASPDHQYSFEINAETGPNVFFDSCETAAAFDNTLAVIDRDGNTVASADDVGCGDTLQTTLLAQNLASGQYMLQIEGSYPTSVGRYSVHLNCTAAPPRCNGQIDPALCDSLGVVACSTIPGTGNVCRAMCGTCPPPPPTPEEESGDEPNPTRGPIIDTGAPTAYVSSAPTAYVSSAPTPGPTDAPSTVTPTAIGQTFSPAQTPTTVSPTPTLEPSPAPITLEPTPVPSPPTFAAIVDTYAPTPLTLAPTPIPTERPSSAPSSAPSSSPSTSPTEAPTETPTTANVDGADAMPPPRPNGRITEPSDSPMSMAEIGAIGGVIGLIVVLVAYKISTKLDTKKEKQAKKFRDLESSTGRHAVSGPVTMGPIDDSEGDAGHKRSVGNSRFEEDAMSSESDDDHHEPSSATKSKHHSQAFAPPDSSSSEDSDIDADGDGLANGGRMLNLGPTPGETNTDARARSPTRTPAPLNGSVWAHRLPIGHKAIVLAEELICDAKGSVDGLSEDDNGCFVVFLDDNVPSGNAFILCLVYKGRMTEHHMWLNKQHPQSGRRGTIINKEIYGDAKNVDELVGALSSDPPQANEAGRPWPVRLKFGIQPVIDDTDEPQLVASHPAGARSAAASESDDSDVDADDSDADADDVASGVTIEYGDEELAVTTVEVHKTPGAKLGLGLARAEQGYMLINFVNMNGLVYQQHKSFILVGRLLVSVNNVDTYELTKEETIGLLKESDVLSLSFSDVPTGIENEVNLSQQSSKRNQAPGRSGASPMPIWFHPERVEADAAAAILSEPANARHGAFMIHPDDPPVNPDRSRGTHVLNVVFQGAKGIKPTRHKLSRDVNNSLVIQNRSYGDFQTVDQLVAALSQDPLPGKWPVKLIHAVSYAACGGVDSGSPRSRESRDSAVDFVERAGSLSRQGSVISRDGRVAPAWLHGPISKDEAAQTVGRAVTANGGDGQGTFLVREGLNADGAPVFDKYALCLWYKGRATHHLVERREDNIWTINGKSYNDKTDLVELIEQFWGDVPKWPAKFIAEVPVGPHDMHPQSWGAQSLADLGCTADQMPQAAPIAEDGGEDRAADEAQRAQTEAEALAAAQQEAADAQATADAAAEAAAAEQEAAAAAAAAAAADREATAAAAAAAAEQEQEAAAATTAVEQQAAEQEAVVPASPEPAGAPGGESRWTWPVEACENKPDSMKVWARSLLDIEDGADDDDNGKFIIKAYKPAASQYVMALVFKKKLTLFNLVIDPTDGEGTTVNKKGYGSFASIDAMVDALSEDPPYAAGRTNTWPTQAQLKIGCIAGSGQMESSKPYKKTSSFLQICDQCKRTFRDETDGDVDDSNGKWYCNSCWDDMETEQAEE